MAEDIWSDDAKRLRKPKKARRGKTGWVLRTARGRLWVAFVIVLAASVSVLYMMFNQQSAEIPILRAANPVTQDLPLTTGDIVVDTIPVGVYPPGELLTVEEFSQGQVWPVANFPAGTPLTRSLMKDFSRITMRVPDGKELVSFSVPASQALNGDLRPGDIVNLTIYGLNITEASAAGDSATGAVTVDAVELKNVRIERVEATTRGLKDGASGENIGPDSAITAGGIPTIYYAFLEPADVNLVKAAMSQGASIWVSVPSQENADSAVTSSVTSTFEAEAPTADTEPGTDSVMPTPPMEPAAPSAGTEEPTIDPETYAGAQEPAVADTLNQWAPEDLASTGAEGPLVAPAPTATRSPATDNETDLVTP